MSRKVKVRAASFAELRSCVPYPPSFFGLFLMSITGLSELLFCVFGVVEGARDRSI